MGVRRCSLRCLSSCSCICLGRFRQSYLIDLSQISCACPSYWCTVFAFPPRYAAWPTADLQRPTTFSPDGIQIDQNKKKVLSRPFSPTLPLLIASTIDGLARIISFPRLTLRSGYWRGRSLVRRPRRAFASFFLKRPPLLDLAPDDLREVTSPATPGSRASAH